MPEERIYFRNNPSVARRTVITTHDGRAEYKINCVHFPEHGGYYTKDIDCIYNAATGAWTIIENIAIRALRARQTGADFNAIQYIYPNITKEAAKPKMVFDHEQQQEVDSSKVKLIGGGIGFDKNGAVTPGNFSRNPLKNCFIVDNRGDKMWFIDYKLLPADTYQEYYAEGVYYNIKDWSAEKIKSLKVKKLVGSNSHNNYNAEDDQLEFQRKIDLYATQTVVLDNDIKYIGRMIKGLTFGAELETVTGALPEHLTNKHGIIICKDGSLKCPNTGAYPSEFVTIPLSGSKGVQTLRDVSKEIQERCGIDIRCSYHLHLGGFKIDRILLVALFKLCCKIQNDVFKMFPYYKTNPRGVKEKNYCNKFQDFIEPYDKDQDFNIYTNKAFQDLYYFLSAGKSLGRNFNMKNKVNPFGNDKWNIKTRYYWVNLINPLFGKRDTIEFRVHTPTLNSDKLINWLLITNAIINYASANTLKCVDTSKVTMADILNHYGDTHKTFYANQLSQNLISYYNDRVAYFKKDYDNSDVTSAKELKDDHKYSFNVLNIK